MFTNNIDALTIDSNQCLYGNGTGLTNIGYNNVINKPNNFPSDWLTTVSNRPDLTIYATNNNLNSLSSTSSLLISNLNATSTSLLSSINNLNSTSTSLLNKTNFSNLIVNGDSTYLSSLNVVGNIIGSGTALTNLNYGSVINPPDLTLYNGWTKITGTTHIYNTGSSGKVGINTTTPQGALEVVGYLNNSWKIKFGTSLSNGVNYAANRIYCNTLFRFLSADNTDRIATFHKTDNYDDPINAPEYFSIKTSGINVN